MAEHNYRQLIEQMLDDQVNKKHVGEDTHLLMLRQRGYLTGLLSRLMHESWTVRSEVKNRIEPGPDTAPVVRSPDR
jgi:hypothetical protein